MVRYRVASKEEEETSFPLVVTTKGRVSVAAFASTNGNKRAANNTAKDGVIKLIKDGCIDEFKELRVDGGDTMISHMRPVVARVAWPESGVSVLLQGYECEDECEDGGVEGGGGVEGCDEGIDPFNPLLTLRRSPRCAKGHTMDACSYQGGRYNGGGWVCDLCAMSGSPPSTPRWCCKECISDFCFGCVYIQIQPRSALICKLQIY